MAAKKTTKKSSGKKASKKAPAAATRKAKKLASCKTTFKKDIAAGKTRAAKTVKELAPDAEKVLRASKRKSGKKSTAKKSTAKKSSAKKSTAKKSTAKKSSAKKSAAAKKAAKTRAEKKAARSRAAKKAAKTRAKNAGKKSAKKSTKKSAKKSTKKSTKKKTVGIATSAESTRRLSQGTGLTEAEIMQLRRMVGPKSKDKPHGGYSAKGRKHPVAKNASLAEAVRRFARERGVSEKAAREILLAAAREKNPNAQLRNNPIGSASSYHPVHATGHMMTNPVDFVKNPMTTWKHVAVGVGLAGLGYVGADVVDRVLATMGSGKCDSFYGSDAAVRLQQKPGALRLGVTLGIAAAGGLGAWYLGRTDRHPYAVASLVGLMAGAGIKFTASVLTSYVMPMILKAEKWEKDKLGSRLYPMEQKQFQEGLDSLIKAQENICKDRKLNEDERLDFIFGAAMAAAKAKAPPAQTTLKFIKAPNHRLFGAPSGASRPGARPSQVGVAGPPQQQGGRSPREMYVNPQASSQAPNQVRQGQEQVGVAGASQARAALPPPPAPPRAPAANAPGHNHPPSQVGVAGCSACAGTATQQGVSPVGSPAWYDVATEMWLDAHGRKISKGKAPMLEEAKAKGAFVFEVATGNYYNRQKQVLFTVPRKGAHVHEQRATSAAAPAAGGLEIPAGHKAVVVQRDGKQFAEIRPVAEAKPAPAAPPAPAPAAAPAAAPSANLHIEKLVDGLRGELANVRAEIGQRAASEDALRQQNAQLAQQVSLYAERVASLETTLQHRAAETPAIPAPAPREVVIAEVSAEGHSPIPQAAAVSPITETAPSSSSNPFARGRKPQARAN